MLRPVSQHRPAILRRIVEALKALLLGWLLLGYSALPAPPLEALERAWRTDATLIFPVAIALATVLLSGVMASHLFTRAWLGLSLAAAILLIREAGQQTKLDGTMLMALAPVCVMLALWVGVATLVAQVWRRRGAPLLERRHRLRTACAALAGLAAGLIVLLHPQLLHPLIQVFAAVQGAPFASDVELALYYSLGGLVAGFTWRLLWPGGQGFSNAAAIALIGLWCALATMTLLDPQDSYAGMRGAAEAAPMAVLLLLPIAGCVLAGLALARWPVQWSEHA